MTLRQKFHQVWWIKAWAALLSFLLLANPLLAQSPTAVIYGKQVKVNGKAISRSQAAQPGDEIQTTGDTASVVGKGNNVLLHSNSIAKLGDRSLDLSCGTALVRTVRDFTTRVDKYTITPQNQSAQYQVSRGAGRIVISALKNAVQVSDGSTGFNILPSGSRTLPDPQGAAQCTVPPVEIVPGTLSTAAAIAWWAIPPLTAGGVAILATQPADVSPH